MSQYLHPIVAGDLSNECFFIAPIGEEGTEIRKRSDGVRDWVVKPAAEAAAGLRTVRADDVGEPGQITAQAIQHCLKAKAAVADLTGGNPNVYYELSVRHGALLPVVLIAEKGTPLPFDISQSRVIFFDHTDLSSAGRAKAELQEQIKVSLSGIPDNPISDGMRLAQLQAGNAEEQTLAVVLDRLQRLATITEQIDERLQSTERREEVARSVRRSSESRRPNQTDKPLSRDSEAVRREYGRIFESGLFDEEKENLRVATDAAQGLRRPLPGSNADSDGD